MDRKQRDIELAREVGFNTEHPATNEWLHQYAQRVRAEAALDKMADNAKELGLGLSTAVVLDATLVRLFLVPAAMAGFGRWNWFYPGHKDVQTARNPVDSTG